MGNLSELKLTKEKKPQPWMWQRKDSLPGGKCTFPRSSGLAPAFSVYFLWFILANDLWRVNASPPLFWMGAIILVFRCVTSHRWCPIPYLAECLKHMVSTLWTQYASPSGSLNACWAITLYSGHPTLISAPICHPNSIEIRNHCTVETSHQGHTEVSCLDLTSLCLNTTTSVVYIHQVLH